jgi:hypothetical protein
MQQEGGRFVSMKRFPGWGQTNPENIQVLVLVMSSMRPRGSGGADFKLQHGQGWLLVEFHPIVLLEKGMQCWDVECIQIRVAFVTPKGEILGGKDNW